MAATAVTREQVIAYRVAAHGLHREAARVGELDVLVLGVQEAMGHPAALAFAARLPEPADAAPAVGPGHRLALAWTFRGAPHVHRRKDLDAVAAALWPLSEADAAARINETGPSVAKAGIPALAQFGLAVEAMRSAITASVEKGAASTAVTAALPAQMRRACRPCGTSHISDSAMRASAPAAGIELEPGTSPPVLLPRAGARLPAEPDPAGVASLALAYLRLLGPATSKEFAGYLDARRADVASCWPDGLAEVTVDGRAAYLPADLLPALTSAPDPELARLLGPFDPYLQARDRDLVVPDKAAQKALWPVLGRPGGVLVDGEIAGTWRARSSGKKLTITVSAFGPLRPSAWDELAVEAERVGSLRGAADVHLAGRD